MIYQPKYKVEKSWIFNDALAFIRRFKLCKRFREKYEVPATQFMETSVSDEEIIIDLLEELPEYYDVEYKDDNNNGYFIVRKIKE